jgi:hypothetical protein
MVGTDENIRKDDKKCWELWEGNDDHGTLGMFLKKKD